MKIAPGRAVLADVDLKGVSPHELVGSRLVTETLLDGTEAEFMITPVGKKLLIRNPKPVEQ